MCLVGVAVLIGCQDSTCRMVTDGWRSNQKIYLGLLVLWLRPDYRPLILSPWTFDSTAQPTLPFKTSSLERLHRSFYKHVISFLLKGSNEARSGMVANPHACNWVSFFLPVNHIWVYGVWHLTEDSWQCGTWLMNKTASHAPISIFPLHSVGAPFPSRACHSWKRICILKPLTYIHNSKRNYHIQRKAWESCLSKTIAFKDL